MAKRKSSVQLTKGGWDVLPHGMGQVPERRYNTRSSIASKENDAITIVPSILTGSVELVEAKPLEMRSSDTSSVNAATLDIALSPGVWFGPTKASLARARAEQANTGIQNLILIKGITVKNNTAVRLGTKITAEATQTKDPHFKPRLSRGTHNPYGLAIGRSPYPHRTVPTPEACEEVHRILTELHGQVVQPEKAPAPSLEVAGCGEVPSVLDALLRTLISGNTQMARANAAIKNLAGRYGTMEDGIGAGSINWEKIRLASLGELVETIKPAGCAGVKGAHIKAILDMVYDENKERAYYHTKAERVEISVDITDASRQTRGQKTTRIAQNKKHVLSLDYMHSMTKDEAMAAFLRYPGIGVKTAACVILFCLRIPCFAVDTHVHKFCQWLGWVPLKASELDSYNHGEFKVPDHLKYGLHQLFIRHGQQCYKCRKATRPGTEEWNEAPECPLEHLLNRGKTGVPPRTSSRTKQRKGKRRSVESSDEEHSEMDQSESSDVEEDQES